MLMDLSVSTQSSVNRTSPDESWVYNVVQQLLRYYLCQHFIVLPLGVHSVLTYLVQLENHSQQLTPPRQNIDKQLPTTNERQRQRRPLDNLTTKLHRPVKPTCKSTPTQLQPASRITSKKALPPPPQTSQVAQTVRFCPAPPRGPWQATTALHRPADL